MVMFLCIVDLHGELVALDKENKNTSYISGQ